MVKKEHLSLQFTVEFSAPYLFGLFFGAQNKPKTLNVRMSCGNIFFFFQVAP